MPAVSALRERRQLPFLRRLLDPVQQVLRFHQFRSEPEEGLPVVPALQLDGGFEQAADVVQRLEAALEDASIAG